MKYRDKIGITADVQLHLRETSLLRKYNLDSCSGYNSNYRVTVNDRYNDGQQTRAKLLPEESDYLAIGDKKYLRRDGGNK